MWALLYADDMAESREELQESWVAWESMPTSGSSSIMLKKQLGGRENSDIKLMNVEDLEEAKPYKYLGCGLMGECRAI